jgi:hypothetical protein
LRITSVLYRTITVLSEVLRTMSILSELLHADYCKLFAENVNKLQKNDKSDGSLIILFIYYTD